MDKIVTIATYYDSLTANLFKAKLEDSEIPCMLADESIIAVQPFFSNAIGGIRLQVFEKDIERAMEVLNAENGLTEDSL